MGAAIRSFRGLRVHGCAVDLQQQVLELSKDLPREEVYCLTDQIRRSSRSIGANIAEAWQKCRYMAHFVSKPTDADGGQAETQHWIGTARACHYLTAEQHGLLMERRREIDRMPGGMTAAPEKFCPHD